MTKSPSPAAAPGIADFERALDELEQLASRMEGGELSLEESLASFERGIGLYRHCREALEQAELKVQLLLNPEDPASAKNFALDKGTAEE